MENQRRAGVVISYLLIFVNAMVGLIYVPLLLNFMTQSEYGLYRLIGSVTVYFTIMDFGLGTVVTRFYTQYRSFNDKIKTENFLALSCRIFIVLALLILILGSILYFFIENLFGQSLTELELMHAKKIYLLLLLNMVLIIIINLFNALIVSHGRFVFLKTLDLIQIIIQPIIIIQIMRVSPEASSLIIVQSFCSFISLIIRAYYCLKNLKITIKYYYFDKEILKAMSNLSMSLFVVAIFDQVYWQGNQIILGSIEGTLAVAVYSIAVQIYMNYIPMASVFSGVFLPKVTEMIGHNKSAKELSVLFIKIGRLQFLFLAAILSGFILYGEEFISLWAGEKYRDAYLISILIMIPFTINLIQTMGVVILQAKNQYGFRALVYAGVGIINIILAIPMAKNYGGIGCAAVTGICYIVGDGIIMNIYYNKIIHLDIKQFWREIAGLLRVVFITCLIGSLFQHITYFSLVINFMLKLVCFSFLYMFMTWHFALNLYEKELFASAIRRIFMKIK